MPRIRPLLLLAVFLIASACGSSNTSEDNTDPGSLTPPENTSRPSLISSFTATNMNDRVFLDWETSMEVDLSGFNVWRADTIDDEYEKLNEMLIFCKRETSFGSTYTFIDPDGLSSDCLYKLEEVYMAGDSQLTGPIAAEAPINPCGTMGNAGGFSLISIFVLFFIMALGLILRQRKALLAHHSN